MKIASPGIEVYPGATACPPGLRISGKRLILHDLALTQAANRLYLKDLSTHV
jgi:hypothetical protein